MFQAEDGIRDLVRSRGLGDVYKRQVEVVVPAVGHGNRAELVKLLKLRQRQKLDDGFVAVSYTHLTPADERSSVDLGGRRIIKKKKMVHIRGQT